MRLLIITILTLASCGPAPQAAGDGQPSLPDVCQSSRACCFYWCRVRRACDCADGQPVAQPAQAQPDMAAPPPKPQPDEEAE